MLFVECPKPSVLKSASQNIPPSEEQVSKLQAGQFEWVLTVPTSDGSTGRNKNRGCLSRDGELSPGAQKLRFGCNLLRRRTQSSGDANQRQLANIYTLVAVRIEGSEPRAEATLPIAQGRGSMSATEVTNVDTTVIRMTEPHREEVGSPRRTSEVAMSGKNNDIIEQIISLPPAQSASRIEDSVEALDQLEDDLEVLNAVTRFKVLSPEETKNLTLGSLESALSPASAAVKTNGSTSKKAVSKAGASTVRVKSAERAPGLRRSSSPTFKKGEGQQATSEKAAPPKPRVARPASLLPPKPPAKSTKPPTMPTFELPGESVARRLKEQREARRSQQISPEQAAALAEFYSPSKPHAKSSKPPTRPTFELPGESVARRLKEQREARRSQQISPEQAAAMAEFYSPAKPHAKSTKPPTRPTFELPGEAISRRKREEHEAKLKAQEEEERKRRDFKARPIRNSIAPGNMPRETIASRARQSKAFQPEASPEAPSPSKRLSIARTSSVRAVSSPAKTTSAAVRGRTSNPGSPSAVSLTRAASTSTSSIHGSTSGQRSTVSSEDAAQQKLRGREIFNRDSNIRAEKERERRDRGDVTRLARQQAAERSRQLSREWAEKQRMKAGPASTKAY
ncbi:hypothetical protein GQ53DRAFT_315178 [Thozetella sp. PMI_491]|nr:hypothetical protein GQ53DRAFT_315178 [Thozetella sp. PMI_491]